MAAGEQDGRALRGRKGRASWAQPSLARDFALLAAAILAVMVLISAWVTWITYLRHSEHIEYQLQAESERIEHILDSQITGANYLLDSVSRQIGALDTRNLESVARLLQAFSVGNPKYALWSWSDASYHVVVSSNQGVLDKGVDIHDRDYVHQAAETPWVPHIGTPIQGRVSERWVIPLCIGVADPAGRYLGALTISMDIEAVTQQIRQLVEHDGVSFAIYSKTLAPLTSAGENAELLASRLPVGNLIGMDLGRHPQGPLSRAGLFSGQEIYSYYLSSAQYPYLIIVGYDPQASDSAIRGLLWPRLAQVAIVAGFLLALLWMVRVRIVAPTIELSAIAAEVAAGREFRLLQKPGSQELELLALNIQRIGDYLVERRRIEGELRAKLAALQERDAAAQMEARQRAALLAWALRSHKQGLRAITVAAQALLDPARDPQEAKHRQYATDIHQSATVLELMVRKLIALSRVDAMAVLTREDPYRLDALVASAAEFAAEGMETPLSLRRDASLSAEALRVDANYLRQALAYGLLYLAGQEAEAPLAAYSRRAAGALGQESLLLLLGPAEGELPPDEAVLAALATADHTATIEEEAQLHFMLARAMFRLQHMQMALLHAESGIWLAVHVPPERLVPDEAPAAEDAHA